MCINVKSKTIVAVKTQSTGCNRGELGASGGFTFIFLNCEKPENVQNKRKKE